MPLLTVLHASTAATDQSTWERISWYVIAIGVTLVGGFILWAFGRFLVNTLVRGIERGVPITDKRTRKALRKARIVSAAPDTVEMRLEVERRKQRARTLGVVLRSAVTVVVVTVVIMTILTIVGLPVGPLVASAGIVGVALGFGAQSLVKDVLTGMFMLLEDQYGVGDIVDLGEAIGTVEEVGLRSTRLRSGDGTVWYVPNGEITRVGNMTRLWSRVMIEVRFDYNTDIDAAKQAMFDAVTAARAAEPSVDSAILSDPEVPGIEAFAYDSVLMRLMVQVNPASQWDVQRFVRREMRRIFAERGILLAAPEGTQYLARKGSLAGTKAEDEATDTTADSKPATKRSPAKPRTTKTAAAKPSTPTPGDQE